MKILPNNRPHVGWKYKWHTHPYNLFTISDQDENRFYFNDHPRRDRGDGQPKEVVYEWFKSGKTYRVK